MKVLVSFGKVSGKIAKSYPYLLSLSLSPWTRGKLSETEHQMFLFDNGEDGDDGHYNFKYILIETLKLLLRTSSPSVFRLLQEPNNDEPI